MKAILVPVALALLAAEARAGHSNRFFFGVGGGGFFFASPRFTVSVPVLPSAPVGHYEWRERRVFVPGFFETVWVEPVYDYRLVGCVRARVCVRSGHCQPVFRDGFYRTERYRVWVPGPGVCY